MGQAERRALEIAKLKEESAFKAAVGERTIGFSAGLQAAAAAIRVVLERKAKVGIITEVTAQAIFEDTGKEIDEAIDRAYPHQEHPADA